MVMLSFTTFVGGGKVTGVFILTSSLQFGPSLHTLTPQLQEILQFINAVHKRIGRCRTNKYHLDAFLSAPVRG